MAPMPVRTAAANVNDLRDQPAYTLAEAARYLKLPTPTLRSWVAGRAYPKATGLAQFEPLIHPPIAQPATLSFWNLIEAHVLRALRIEHKVSIRAVREALKFAGQQLRVERLLLSRELCTQGGELFLEKYGQLINLSASGQLALRHVLAEHLKRVEWDECKFPIRLYPFVSVEAPSVARPIAIDPNIAFGRPILVSMSISTGTIAERIDAGEMVADLADDYELTPAEIEQAVLYERAA